MNKYLITFRSDGKWAKEQRQDHVFMVVSDLLELHQRLNRYCADNIIYEDEIIGIREISRL